MAWTDPRTWVVDELVEAAQLNEQVRDNQNYLLSPNHTRILRANAGDYSITNVTSFADIDSTYLTISLVTYGGPVWVHFAASVQVAASQGGSFDIYVDGVAVDGTLADGLMKVSNSNIATVVVGVSFSVLLTSLAAGTYVIRPRWKTDAGDTMTLLCGTAVDVPVILEAIEL